MIVQNIDLNMIPESEPVVVHVNQYDVGENRIVASLYDGAQAYTPASGATAVIQGMKPDGKGFDYNATILNNTVMANVTEQMTAVEGKTRCQIVITEGNNVTGTFVFYLMVQRSALPADADMSRSEYDVVMQLIEQAEAISVNVPYIGANGNWWVYSVQEEGYVDTGVDASISVDIADITMIEPSATPYVTNTGTDTDPVFHLFIPRGKGISTITKTGTQGLVDTYTITYSDGATTTFTVTNGADGEDGRGITSITKTSSTGLDDTYTITYTDGTTSQFVVRNGNAWYTGTNISGKGATPTVYPSSGVSWANLHDLYLNTTEDAVYQCVHDGIPSTAEWSYITDIKGDSGADGYSPVVTITNITGGHRVNITDKTHPSGQNFDVMDGTGTGDMRASVYDANSDVANAGGIPNYTSKVSGELIKDTVGWTGKNLFAGKFTTQTVSGITYTVNEDGSVNVNGTATANSYISSSVFVLKSGSYIANGIAGGSDGTYYCDISKTNGTAISRFKDGDEQFTTNEDFEIRLWLNVKSGQTLNNKTFYPMLRKADLTDPTYEPYHADVEQTLRDAEVIEGKNLLPNNATSGSLTGVNYTVNADGSVTLNGTATAGDSFTLCAGITLRKGSYILSKTGRSDVRFQITDYPVTQQLCAATTDDVPFDLSADTPVAIRIGQFGDTTYNNVTIYPMLRYASETDPTYEPYYIPLKDSKFDRSEQRVLGAKNLLRIPSSVVTQTKNNITYTITRDSGGQVTEINANGTANASGALVLVDRERLLGNGRYILSGCETSNNYTLYVNAMNGSSFAKQLAATSTGAVEFDVDYVGYDSLSIGLYVDNNKTLNNVKFYPMLRLASDPDDTYVPYAMTNKELTDVTETEASQVASGATVVDNKILKSGNIVSLHFRLTGATVAAWGVLGVVPEGYRPKYTVTMRDTVGNKYVQISSSGAITPSDALSNAAVSLFATWIKG